MLLDHVHVATDSDGTVSQSGLSICATPQSSSFRACGFCSVSLTRLFPARAPVPEWEMRTTCSCLPQFCAKGVLSSFGSRPFGGSWWCSVLATWNTDPSSRAGWIHIYLNFIFSWRISNLRVQQNFHDQIIKLCETLLLWGFITNCKHWFTGESLNIDSELGLGFKWMCCGIWF